MHKIKIRPIKISGKPRTSNKRRKSGLSAGALTQILLDLNDIDFAVVMHNIKLHRSVNEEE